MGDPSVAIPLADLRVDQKVVAIQRGGSSQFAGTISRITPVQNGLRTIWIRREGDTELGVGLQVRVASPGWTFYPQPDPPTGQGPAPQAGGARPLNPFELEVGQYVTAHNWMADLTEEGEITDIDDDPLTRARTVTVNGRPFFVPPFGEISPVNFTAAVSPLPDTPISRSASSGSGKRTRKARRRRTHNAVRKSTRHVPRRR
jgi:hypothetical protein